MGGNSFSGLVPAALGFARWAGPPPAHGLARLLERVRQNYGCMESRASQPLVSSRSTGLIVVALVLFGVLAVLFHNVFLPGYTLFSNDGPLGTQMSRSHAVPDTFSGGWQDLNSLGFREGGASPSITYALAWLLGPVGYSKFYAFSALLFLGLGAWCFFRQLKLAPVACVLGALAASLNSGFFSAACWGVAAHPLTIGLCFFALAALVNAPSEGQSEPPPRKSLRHWIQVVLAGLAVGMAVMEGADIGAIFSIYVAAFIVYQTWIAEGQRGKNLALGITQTAIVAVFAGFLAAQTISVLVSTQIQGVVGTQQDTRTKQERWDFATQWSLPKQEALGLVVPGLFGYRMDTPEGGNYWGAAGRDPAWYRWVANGKQGPQPGGFMRFTGGGNYAGVLVVLLAVWAAFQGFRREGSVFSPLSRRWIWFWVTVAAVSLLLAFGRFAPFYRLLYELPYFSTIRNPAKFTHVFNWAVVVLFAYGVHGLWRKYVTAGAGEKEPVASSASRGPRDKRGAATPSRSTGIPGLDQPGLVAGAKLWWQRVRGFDRRWTLGVVATFGVALLAALIYSSSRGGLEQYLQGVGFDAGMAKEIAGFSIGQVGWFLLFFAVAIGLMILVLSGGFSGRRAKWGGALLGLFLVLDLGRANQPWIITWDYQQKYASNPIIDFLRDKPYEHRVAIMPQFFRVPPNLELVNQLYKIEWAQHHFLYYDIQSLDVVQMPRMPEDLAAFEATLQPWMSPPHDTRDLPRLTTRRWQLTNTRYLVGAADLLPALNQQIDPEQHRFRIAERFQIVPKPGEANPTRLEQLTALPDTNGPFALIEFTGTLPRAKLYTNWVIPEKDAKLKEELKNLSPSALADVKQIGTNDFLTLRELASPTFDPEKEVLVSGPVASATSSGETNGNSGTLEFASYAPKDIVLKAEAKAPAVLLLNDRFDPNWFVTVDGKPETLLRCNYLMRGVYVPAGAHRIEFKFQPPMRPFYVSLVAVCTGLLLCGLLLVVKEPGPTGSEGLSAANQTRGTKESQENRSEGSGTDKEAKGREMAGKQRD